MDASGYKYEGIVGYIQFCNPGMYPGTVPLYRLYSPTTKDHFYTASASERQAAINYFGYTDEGIAGDIFPTAN